MPATQIATRQLQDGAVTNAKIAAGAAIESSKLADGANWILRSGAVAMTGNFDAGNQRLVNVATPSTGTDGVNRNYVDNAISALNSFFDNKPSVRVASTASVTIASPGSAIDGVTLTALDRVLLKNQASPQDNGTYVFNGAASPMTRATDMDAWAEIPGALVAVEEGTANADTVWLCSANQGGTLNTTAITWTQLPTTAGLLTSNFVTRETPSGAMNGSNVTFTLANTPTVGTEQVYLNGVQLDVGAGDDYTISGATITMLTAPLSTDKLQVSYMK